MKNSRSKSSEKRDQATQRRGKSGNQTRPDNKGSRRRTKRGAPAPDGQLRLYGLHTVNAALANPKRRKSVLNTTENALARLDEKLVAKTAIEVRLHDPRALDGMVGPEAVHQGVVLECEPLDGIDASELFHLADTRLVLALDQITDPHNVGAILRSAVAFGVSAVLVTRRNSAVETAVLAKSASGALDMPGAIKSLNVSNAAALSLYIASRG